MLIEDRSQDHRAMNDNSAVAQTPERKPPPEIEGKRSSERSSLPPVGDGRALGRSGCDERVGDATVGFKTIHLDLPAVPVALSQRLGAAGLSVTPGRAFSVFDRYPMPAEVASHIEAVEDCRECAEA